MNEPVFTERELIRILMPLSRDRFNKLRNLHRIVKKVRGHRVPGAIVECGVYRGYSAAVLMNAAGQRRVWLFDSFRGLPYPTDEDIGKRKLRRQHSPRKVSKFVRARGSLSAMGHCVASLLDVEDFLFGELGLNQGGVELVEGWFQKTLPIYRDRMKSIALLHIDADWYESVTCVLENLYDNVEPGGYIAVDDYNHWPGCKLAVDAFLERKGITPKMAHVFSAAYWRKA